MIILQLIITKKLDAKAILFTSKEKNKQINYAKIIK
jgi:hypothetical protein